MLNYILQWFITCSITSCLDQLHDLLHAQSIQYIHYMQPSLVASAAAAIAASPRRRDRRARGQQSFFCWIHFAGQYSSEVEQCRWWLGRQGWASWAVIGMSRMWLLNIQAILPSSKIQSARSNTADWEVQLESNKRQYKKIVAIKEKCEKYRPRNSTGFPVARQIYWISSS